ncbi:MAG TPA: phosphatidylglycerol lysyltransferase domain-containing protein [Solirubrobacteraceae bacterium]|nr:phosphatidylglycerol lysyltransferase domain-containing protein [Solirubrobacteraceae bacterium]
MSRFLLIALRKRRARSIVLIGCLALAAWSLLASLLPGGSGDVLLALGLGADALALGGLTALALSRRRASASLAGAARRHDSHDELAAARHLVDRYGEDSISPFIVRPDKAYAFAAGGVISYRVFGRTAVVSGDPVAPAGAAPAVAARFLDTARAHGWDVAVYGASEAQLQTYHRLGLRSMCVGEEAVVRPENFSLDGRPVRKLRQSVHRVERRGWQIVAFDGIDIDLVTEAEIEALETRWRAQRPRLLGFAMSMGPYEAGIRPRDLYLLARSPEGALTAAMHFVAHRGKLSLATMRRVGENPNGLNEALVCRAIEVARERGVSEVSLNYAGLAHVIRGRASGGWLRRGAIGIATAVLGRRFQMERLIRFNDKFAPQWRPRYLVYPSRRALPRTIYRVLQAEGYLGRRWDSRRPVPPVSAPRSEPVPSSVRAYVSGR